MTIFRTMSSPSRVSSDKMTIIPRVNCDSKNAALYKWATMTREKGQGRYYFRFGDLENNYLSELRKNRSKLSWLIWLILFMTMIGFCAYLAYALLAQYNQHASYNLEYTYLANSYTLPAITICNTNLLNKTAMDSVKIEKVNPETKFKYTVYDVYKNLTRAFKKIGTDYKQYEYEDLDTEDIYTQYRMKIGDAVVNDLTFMAKAPTNYKNFTKFGYTSNGLCLEINDGQDLVQKVNGAIGGFHITLDAQTEYYLPETEHKGFIITLRMPNETILSQEFGFLVSPGREYHINLRTLQVTRLEAPWGNCRNTADLIDNVGTDTGFMTLRECYLNQMLWMYAKLADDGCGCFPWYFYQRYIADKEDTKYNSDVKWRLMKYWTEELIVSHRLSFNGSCEYTDDDMVFTSKKIGQETEVSLWKGCRDICKATTKCRYYMHSTSNNDIMNANECYLYEEGASIVTSDGRTSSGITRGDTQCMDMEQCPISAGKSCLNHIMSALMAASGDLDENGKSSVPPTCYEPCSYSDYKYSISSSLYPTKGYWQDYLQMMVNDKDYTTYEDATSNLVKLVFFTDQMSTINVIQTASYEISSFISELGGLTDLFIGLSFFTAYQLLEWIITKTVRKVMNERDKDSESNDVRVEDAEL